MLARSKVSLAVTLAFHNWLSSSPNLCSCSSLDWRVFIVITTAKSYQLNVSNLQLETSLDSWEKMYPTYPPRGPWGWGYYACWKNPFFWISCFSLNIISQLKFPPGHQWWPRPIDLLCDQLVQGPCGFRTQDDLNMLEQILRVPKGASTLQPFSHYGDLSLCDLIWSGSKPRILPT